MTGDLPNNGRNASAMPGSDIAVSGSNAPTSRGRGERVFRIVAVAMLLVLVITAAPGWFIYRGYSRARWADERGIELLVKIEFGDFAPSLRASEGAALGRRGMHAASYDMLKKPGSLDDEAGGEFWSGFYGLGTQFYHHTVGNRIGRPLSATEIKNEKRRALEQRARKTTETATRCERLVGLLGHSDFRKREAATEEIRRLGSAAVLYLRRAAVSPDPEVADRARRLLKELPPQNPGTTSQ